MVFAQAEVDPSGQVVTLTLLITIAPPSDSMPYGCAITPLTLTRNHPAMVSV